MNYVARGVSVPTSALAELTAKRQRERKWLISYRSVEQLALTTDVISIFATALLTGVLYHWETTASSGDILHYAASGAAVAALFLSITIGRSLYDPAELLDLKAQIQSVGLIWAGVFLFYAGVVFALKVGADFSRGAVLLFAIGGLGVLSLERLFWYLLLRRALSGEKFSGRNAVLIAQELPDAEFLATLRKHGFELERQFLLPAEKSDALDSEDVAQIAALLRDSPQIEEVLVTGELERFSDVIRRLSRLRNVPITVSFIPLGMSAKILTRPTHRIGDKICIELQRKPLNATELAIKRVMDIACALVGLITLLPLLLITALAIKLDSPGPALFRQRRRGFNGKEFSILKFRTMTVLEDGKSIIQAKPNDQRLTRLGKWLRRTSIDELPQLLNVLWGSMSLVGPRPHAVAHDNEFDKVVRHYAVRQHVKPGLTGWAQIHGCRGPTPTAAEIKRRVDYDLWYIDNWNLRLDCLIAVRTALEVFRGRNAY